MTNTKKKAKFRIPKKPGMKTVLKQMLQGDAMLEQAVVIIETLMYERTVYDKLVDELVSAPRTEEAAEVFSKIVAHRETRTQV